MAYRSKVLPVAAGGTDLATLTAHSLYVGNGVTAPTALGVAASGAIPIGSAGADPVLALPTNGNNISWTGGAGTLTANLTGVTQFSSVVGSASGSLTSLGVATNGQILMGSTGASPVLGLPTNSASITWSGGAGTLTASTTSAAPILNYVEPGVYPYVVLSTDYTIGVDTTAARTINLPNAPTTGTIFVVKDFVGNASVQNINVTTVGGVVLIDSAATYGINVNYGSITVQFNGTKYLIL